MVPEMPHNVEFNDKLEVGSVGLWAGAVEGHTHTCDGVCSRCLAVDRQFECCRWSLPSLLSSPSGYSSQGAARRGDKLAVCMCVLSSV